MKIKLNLCLCCGSVAEFWKSDNEGEYDGGWFIECTNPLCRLTTALVYATGDDPKQNLANRWNQRVSITPEGWKDELS